MDTSVSVPSAPLTGGLSDPPVKSSRNIEIEIPPSSIADDEAFVATLVGIINAAYTETEADIFKPGYVRTSVQDIGTLIRSGQLATASEITTPSGGRVPLGCISIQKLSDSRAELGLFAVAAELRRQGLGRDLLRFAEQWCLDNLGGPGVAIAELHLLFPTHFEHPFKVRLQEWYTRKGYHLTGSRDFLLDYPQLEPLLAGPTEYRILQKKLT
ncbi:uncharacterized protein F4812DRAFT_268536 [Daldinia caldariorum]|uniref:uncharacterized protein n=1 Tax=Daldinia caldariorum TaxID=326644 RepID=UPI002008DBBB|nr:uncharacterized protein F4812DRAFT_268536 [Daldinia caldariorum]KAI1470517.1 hypothetical protein F4812DRAFT_268536 [Daldinia caldariorum]